MRVLCISVFFRQTMEVSSRHLKQFLFSQYLADGIRTTVQVIIPAVVFAQFGHLEEGITISLGALCISIADAPGPLKHKRNGMLYANLFVFLLAVLTGLVNNNAVLLGILIGVASFFFSMFSVYGNRAASIGTATKAVDNRLCPTSPVGSEFENCTASQTAAAASSARRCGAIKIA